ncbi:hypothetical protein FOMG_17404 [Fusarium oxysporum f. sp. melonis 26406]|uniref:Uncharacterized protein n=1 Tax=Fusarium oxysporum f. sp. melonis 26406 TaxID=1089452 RepID=W9Z2M0_FUSOX|nr:hypothetical protein FOMG_17404 [Fusarium oxysporum f. sp. melonis 26406]
MSHRSVLHRFANLFMNKRGDNYAGLETSSHSTLSLVWNKQFSVNQKTAKPAMARELLQSGTKTDVIKQAGRRRYNIYSGWRGLSTVIVELFGRRALLQY